MRNTHHLIHWRLLVIVALVFGVTMIGSAPVFALSGTVTSTATPSNATPTVGQTITVPIAIDMSGVNSPDNALGSYTGSLDWNTAVLAYASHSGAPPAGFAGNVNINDAATGHIVFNGANATGATGPITVLTVTFNVIAAGTSALNLEYSAMAAASTFANLKTILTITDGSVTVSGPSHTVTFNANGGTGSMSSQTASVPTALTMNTFTRTGYNFTGWNTVANGSGTAYANGATYSFAADITLYAQWTSATCSVTSSVSPSNPTPAVGQQIVVTFAIDMNGACAPDNALGSFTASLAWDPTILTYVSNSGLLAGFTGAINIANTGTGAIAFNGANAAGATGNFNVFTITFDVVGAGTSPLNLGYSAMAAASTFVDLLPVLTVNDGQVVVPSAATYTLTTAVSPAGGGTINPAAGPHTYNFGTTVTVTATPASGYVFSGWSGACSGTGACSVVMNANKTVTANFTAGYTLTIAVSPAGSGTTSPAAGTYTYTSGTVNITATPASGYVFSGWSGACTGTGTCSVTMSANRSVTANFTSGYTLTTAVSPTGGGTTNPAVGAHVYSSGTVVPVTATPSTGYVFSSWSGACTGAGTCSVTMNANKTVTANFIGGQMASRPNPSNAAPAIGDQIVVSILVSTNALDPLTTALGSFTGSLTWDPAILAYNSNSGILHGFDGTVDIDSVATGRVDFNGSDETGATGAGDALTITFDVVGPGTSVLDLAYTAMAAASSGTSLMPLLIITDSQVVVPAPSTYTLTTAVNPAAGGTTNPAVGTHAYAPGTLVSVTATPAAGYTFSSWSGACTGAGTCQVTMDANKTVTANFVAVSGTIVSAPTPSDAAPAKGEQVVVTITIDMTGSAAPNNALGSFTSSLAWNPAVLAYSTNSGLQSGFTGAINTANVGTGTIAFNGANASGATGNVTVLTITFDVVGEGTSVLDLAYSAMAAANTFTNLIPILTVNDSQVVAGPAEFDLTVSASPVSGGTTSPALGSHTYTDGTVVTVTATPATGYVFSGWSGACTGTGACQVTMDADKAVTANFTLVTHTLVVAVSPAGGGATSPAAGTYTYDYGTVVNVTATPADGYAFSGWSGACTGTGACQVTMDGNKTVTANFEVITYSLYVPLISKG